MSFCAFAPLVTTFIFFSALDKSRVQWDNSQNSTQKMRTIVWHIYLLHRVTVSGTRLVEWHNRRIYGTWDCKSTITDSNHQTCIRVVQPTPLHTPGMPTSACNCMTIVPVPEMTGTNTRIWLCAEIRDSRIFGWLHGLFIVKPFLLRLFGFLMQWSLVMCKSPNVLEALFLTYPH